MTSDDMNNDELIDRLRRTFHREAAAINPNPQSYLGAAQAPPTPLRRRRPPWPVAVAAAAVIAAAVALVAATLAGGGGPRVRVGVTVPPAATGTTLAPVQISPTTVHPATTVPVAPVNPTVTSAPPATTTVPPPAVAAGFQPASVTFVSPTEGWSLGTAPCPAGRCLSMARTYDAGQSWQAVSAPNAGDVFGATPANLSVRFADPNDGWIYAITPSASSNPSRLWSTHDGGQTWQPVHLSILVNGIIEDLEAANHLVQMAVTDQNDGNVHLEIAPVGTDHWTDVNTGVPVGAGPVPATQLVLQGAAGWLIQNDRTVVGGARTAGAGHWSSWTPPCSKANGTAALAASSSTSLIALCNEGVWGPPGNIPANGGSFPYPQWLFRSNDGGASFQAVRSLPVGFSGQLITTSPSPATVVLAGYAASDSAALWGSFDGGATWQTVYQSGSPTQWKDLGFTTTEQGVALASGPSGSQLLMTRDGGHHWAAVSF